MRIALISTNIYPTPPIREKIIFAPLWISYYLAEGLKKRGHKVYVFGSSDSETSANIVSGGLSSLRKNKEWFHAYQKLDDRWKEIMKENYEFFLLSKLGQMAQAKTFDIIQFHSKPRLLHLASLIKTPVIFTLHDPLDHPIGTGSLKTIYDNFRKEKIDNLHFISISNAQRKPLPTLNYAATIYNGIDTEKFSFGNKKREYLAFVGRIVDWKGVHIAVRVAKKMGKKLRIAGYLPNDYIPYFKKTIKPYLSHQITFEGLLNEKQMVSFYKNAEALLMPIAWEEPFGLVMTEAMACGTPVIAFRRGSVPEVIKDTKTGFIIEPLNKKGKPNIEGLVSAIKKIDQIDRRECRKHVEKNFTIEKMVDEYEKVYEKILKK